MRHFALTIAAAALLLPAPLGARKPGAQSPPAPVTRLMACRALADPVQRLACFDRESGALDQALAARNLVVIDRETSRAAKRSLFGFSVPSFGGLFGGGEDEVREIESTVTGIGRSPDGGFTVRLADGSTWSQTDDTPLGLGPRKGDKVKVMRRTLGAFSMSVNGQPAVRVRRVG